MDAASMLSMARRRAGLSQRELSRRTGIPQATISRIENRVVSPTFDTLAPLIEACGMGLRIDDREGIGVDRSQFSERLRMSPLERAKLAVNAASAIRRIQRTLRQPARDEPA
jgi:transcriptional regulator with XRE-family HTH domain